MSDTPKKRLPKDKRDELRKRLEMLRNDADGVKAPVDVAKLVGAVVRMFDDMDSADVEIERLRNALYEVTQIADYFSSRCEEPAKTAFDKI
jgi:hypothetical protein